MKNIDLRIGDCLEVLKEIEDNSIDSIVTDPPYGLNFMGKKWDYQVPSTEVWKECLRVLKPGGHLLSFAGSRTYHRIAINIEDAGFEIRDQIMWLYGSGFPKSHNIGKAIDKIQGNEREVVGEMKAGQTAMGQGSGWNKHENRTELEITKGSSAWEGWGTALKPAHEPICMARKPLSEKTVAENVLRWGTGGININESKIFTDENLNGGAYSEGEKIKNRFFGGLNNHSGKEFIPPQGRFPANLILDEEAGKVMDLQSGKLNKQGKCKTDNKSGWQNEYVGGNEVNAVERKLYLDEGGASRFFYCAKASKKDRNEGCDTLEETTDTEMTNRKEGSNGLDWNNGKGVNAYAGASSSRNGNRKNLHPTVKPTDLMLYLIRLVTPKGGITLDPFMGSGSSGKAAVRGGFQFVGIEREAEYFEIAEVRIEHEQKKPNQIKIFE